MYRKTLSPRRDFEERALQMGFDYHDEGGVESWTDDVCYMLTGAEAISVMDAVSELHEMSERVVEHLLDRPDLLIGCGIPDYAIRRMRQSRDVPAIMGRMDLGLSAGSDQLKLIEYNADTPFTFIETALIQSDRIEQEGLGINPSAYMINNAINGFRAFLSAAHSPHLHLATYTECLEDRRHVEFYGWMAKMAGAQSVKIVHIKDLRPTPDGDFVDADGERVETLYKLYPWEWIFHDRAGQAFTESRMTIGEPLWRTLLNNKAFLCVLSDLYPGHPLVLKAKWSPGGMESYVTKHCYGRGGQNITIIRDGETVASSVGGYQRYRPLYQEYLPLRREDGFGVQLGAWCIAGRPSGIIAREDRNLIIHSASRLAPIIQES